MKTLSYNKALFFKLNSLAKRTKASDRLIIFWATYLIFFVLGVGLVFFLSSWVRQIFSLKGEDVFFVAIAAVLAWIASILLKALYFFPRPLAFAKTKVLIPKSKLSPAFPSGHTAFFFAAGCALYFFNPLLGVILLLLGLGVGLARIIAGLHWPLDILGGAVLGWGLALLLRLVLLR